MGPPKDKKGGGGGDEKELGPRNVLQAVVLADSFTQSFRPITLEHPKALLPLVNVAMIEYTLEWLAMSGVEEVFVFCCAHAEQITGYLQESKWSRSKEMLVTPIVSTSCFSAGEAMRLIDQKDIIKNDFVLINGDTVCNINLAPIMEAHRARRQADKSNIFTMVTKSVHNPLQRLRMGDRENVMCLDPSNNRLIKFYEAHQGEHGGEGDGLLPPTFKLDAAFFSERDNVTVRTDLVDTQIYICAPEVLMLFSDNFDYQSLKPDFITGVLSEEELGNKLFITELGRQEYAAHVRNLRAYDAISRDILQRWPFPLVPDTHLLWRGGVWGPTTYRYARGNRYLEQALIIPRTAYLGEDVAVGAGTQIGEDAHIRQSVIGRNCRIGKNVDILGSYILDNASIQDGAVLRYALVCDSAVISPRATVSAGAVISHKVVVGPSHIVPPHTRVSLCSQVQQEVSLSDDELEYSGAATMGRAAVGKTKKGGNAQKGKKGAGSVDGSEDGDSDASSQTQDGGSSSGSEADVLILSTGPCPAAAAAAESLALGHVPDQATLDEAHFDVHAVGSGGAGYQWKLPAESTLARRRLSVAPPSLEDLPAEDEDVEITLGDVEAAAGPKAAEGSDSDEDGEEVITDPEVGFKREVSETFLRCVKLRFDQTNAVIELNGLKIAEDRTFADCARYIFTTLLAMCGPAPTWVKDEYASLFLPRGSPSPPRAALVASFRKHLAEWRPLLQRFLRSEDDQVELLLTFEEYCNEEGVFENQAENGKAFADIFEPMLKIIYDAEVVSEEAIIAWADEKQMAEEEEKKLLRKAEKFIEWLRASDDESSEEEESD